MISIPKIKERIAEAPKDRRQSMAEQDNSTKRSNNQKEKYEQLFELSPIGIIILDMKGVIRFCNPAGYNIAGFAEKDIIGKYFLDVAATTSLTKSTLTKYQQIFKSLVNGETPQPFDVTYKTKDGTIVNTVFHASLLHGEGSNAGIIVYMIDITERKRTEEALRESEDKFSKAFRNSPDAIAITTLEDGRFIEVNDSYTRITGYTREEVIGHRANEFGSWAKAEERDRILQILKKEGRVRHEEVNLRMKSGETRVALFSAEPINIDGEPCMISVAADINERKQVEEAIRESEEFSTSLLENAPNPITVIKPDTSIKYVNPAFEKMTGFSLAEIAGMEAPYPWWPEERRAQRTTGLKNFMSGGDKITQQTIQNKNGERFRIEMNMVRVMHNGEFRYYLAHWNDINEQKKAEEALANEVFWRRILVEQSLDGIVILDENSKVYEANQRFAEMLGYSPEEVLELHTWDWDKEYPPEQLLEMGRNVDAEGLHLETRHQRKDGTFIDVEISINGAVCAGQKFIFCVCRDITERKKMEEALAASENDKKSILNAISDIVLFHQDSSLTIKWANEAAARSVGKSQQDLVGKHCYQLWHERNKPCDDCPVIRALETKSSVTGSMKTPDGRSWEILGEPVYDSDGKMIGAIEIAHDITEQKKAEEALANEAVWRRILVEQSSDGIVILDQDGKVVEANRRFAEMLGYSSEEVLQLNVWDWEFLYPREKVEDMIRTVDEAGDHFETQHRRKDGTIYDVEISTNGAIFGGQKLIFCVCRDITERKQAEEALRESQEFSNSLLENAPNQVVVINPDTSVRYVNQAFVDANGWTFEEAVGLKVPYPWWPEENTEEFTEGFRQAMEQGSGTGEVTARKKNGELYWIALNWTTIKHNGEMQFMLVNSTDITERKKMEEALIEAENKYRDLLDNSNELIQSVTPDGHFRYVNNGWRQALGYTEDEISNLTVYEIIHPDYLPKYKMLFENIKPGDDIGHISLTLKSKSGNKIIVEGNVTCKFENDELIYTRGIFRDITQNKYLEEQMFRLSSAVSMSTDCIVITDFDAKIIDVNQRTLEMYGADNKEELIGKHFLELIAPAERVTVNMDVREIMEKGSLECREYNIVSKHGHEFPVQMSTSLVRNAEGKPMGMVRVGRELSGVN